ncbi:YqaI family protein [Bacillus sp. C1]
MNKVADHPIEDVFGDEIIEGDTYFVFGQNIVLLENLKSYLIQYHNVECFQAQ